MGANTDRPEDSKVKESSKYYTPSIEEFRVGFEFESNYVLFSQPLEWTKVTLKDNWFWESYEEDAVETEFRVKYIDRADIESIGGWEFVKEYKEPGSYYLEFKQRHTELTLYPALEETMVFIEHGSAVGIGYPVFKGKIKNISELKVLLNQLEI